MRAAKGEHAVCVSYCDLVSCAPGLLLLQGLSRVGAHEAEGLEGDGSEGYQQDDSEGCGVDGRGVPDADGICLEPSAEIGVR